MDELFWAKVDKDGPGPCWLWTGYVMPNGYGRLTRSGRPLLAHRYAYELVIGPIPAGLELDHVKDRGCTSRACVNPAHLEPVSRPENVHRQFADVTHCPQGHEYTDGNTLVKDGCRNCRACHREAERERYRRSRGLTPSTPNIARV